MRMQGMLKHLLLTALVLVLMLGSPSMAQDASDTVSEATQPAAAFTQS